jgi:glucose/arabinose dehydrogenase
LQFGCGSGGSGAPGNATFQAVTAATGLSSPVALAFAPDGRLFVCEKEGVLKVLQEGQAATTAITLNVSTNSEQGLLGIALDPNFDTNHFVYLYYTTSGASQNPPPSAQNRISRFMISGNVINPASETVLLQGINAVNGNHNGGCLRFGQDGKLYAGVGDGGESDTAQDLASLNGKILRINPDGSVPNDNPFVGQGGRRGEIYAYGLRNPFRFTIRTSDQALVIGDVGQDTFEEVNVGGSGANFGWPIHEGPSNAAGFVSPVHSYNHNGGGASITGGTFATSSSYPQGYQGHYFYADFILNKIVHFELRSNNTVANVAEFGPSEGLSGISTGIVDIVAGPSGDLYLVDYQGGRVLRISASSP